MENSGCENKTCETCNWNDDCVCDIIGIFVDNDESCDKYKSNKD